MAADTGSGLPATAPELLARQWPARWITHPAAPKSDYGVYLFRKVLDLPARPARFVVHVPTTNSSSTSVIPASRP